MNKSRITINQQVIEAIIAHSRLELPNESCGYLAGDDGIMVKHYEMTNLDKASDHFSMDPKEQFAAIKDIRRRGLKLVGVYHSHPETPARPSEEDIRLAYDPEISYVIVSMAESEPDVKSFRIKGGAVLAEKIEIVDSTKEVDMTAKRDPDLVKDCSGVGCPMNMVYTKVELAKLESGQLLEIILDDGPPINNVPGSVTREGHKILEKRQLEDGNWSVLIEKK